MSSDSELSAFFESSNDDMDIDVVYSASHTCRIILQSHTLVHNTTSSGHFGQAIQRPFLRAKSHNFQVL